MKKPKVGSCRHPRPCGPGCDPLAASLRSRSSGRSRYRPRYQFHASESSCPLPRTRQHSASFSSPPSPQPKCRPRSRLLHFHRFVFACALAAPFGEGVVACATTPAPPQWSALSVGVIRPGASRPGTDHASPLPVDCYCLGMASVLCIFACSRSSPLRSGSLLPSALPFTNARGTE